MTYQSCIVVVAIFMMLGSVGCSDLSEEPKSAGTWAIYFLADPNLTSHQVRGQSLNNLQLANSPGMTVGDVLSYKWETHEIGFTPAVESRLDSLRDHGYTGGGVPFVVVVDEERIYLGALWWGQSSLLPGCPYIELIFRPRSIRLPSLYEGADPRADMRIYQSLKASGILIEPGAPSP